MTIDEILEIKNEDARMKSFRQFKDKKRLTPYQKMVFVSELSNENYILEFFSNELCFDINTFSYAFVGNFSDSFKDRIINDSALGWLRDKVSRSNMSEDNIREIIYALGCDKNKVFKILDPKMPYYKENENFILRNITTSYDERTIDYLLKMERINPAERENIKRRLKDLFDVNDEILSDVNFQLLTDKYGRLGKKITVLSRYPEIQKRILSLTNKEFSFLCDSIDYLTDLKIDWVPLVDDLLLNMKDYSSIINHDIGFGLYMRSLKTDKDKKKSFFKVLSIISDKNKYKFKSFSEILEGTRSERIGEIADEELFKLSDVDKMKALVFEKLLGMDLKTAKRFHDYYTQDYERAIKEADWSDSEIALYLVNSEGITARDPEFNNRLNYIKESNGMVKRYIEFLHDIFASEDIDQLRDLLDNITPEDEISIPNSVIDSNFRAFYTRLFNKKLYRPKPKDLISIDSEDAYLMPDDAWAILTSTEAYAKGNDGKTIVHDWNSKKIKNHVICATAIGGGNFSVPPIQGVNYGFVPIDSRAILKAAPYDTGVWPIARSFDVYKNEAKYAFGAMFMTPESTVEHTLRRHGEIDIERENYEYESNSVFKTQPSYTISIVDVPLSSYFKRDIKDSEILTADVLAKLIDHDKMEDLSYREDILSKSLRDDPKWKKTLQDSKAKDIKRTIVDLTHTLIVQRIQNDEIEKKLLSYTEEQLKRPEKMQEFLNLVEKMIVSFDSARASTIQKEIKGWDSNGASIYGDLLHRELHDKLFSNKVMDNKLWKVEELVKKCNPEIYKAFMLKMKNISKKQVDKLDKQYWWYEKDTSHDWWDYYKYASRQLSGMTYKNEANIIRALLDKKIDGTSIQGGAAVKKIIQEIGQMREYEIPKGKPDWHGRRHINDVVLFSYLIAQHEGKMNGRGIEILLQAAKYHDVGRDGIWNGLGEGKRHDEDVVPHAYPSALAAEFYMKRELKTDGSRKYTDAEIAMVKVAIEYHEVHEKNRNQFNEEVFASLCEKEGVRPEDIETAKLISIYLKDADAVDRTRFMYKNAKSKNHLYYSDGLDMRYLRTDTAVALRDFSRAINNRHFNNKTGKLYIPDVLDIYTVPPSREASQPWELIKRDIYRFLTTHSIAFDPSNPSRITRQEIQSMLRVPEEKGLFCSIRAKIKAFFNKLREKAANTRDENSDDREVL